MVRINLHHAGRDFLFCCSLKTELTDTKAFFGANRRTKRTAGDGPRSVEIAHPASRIERGTRLVVREVLEALFQLGIQYSRFRVPGEFRSEPNDAFIGACANPRCAVRVGGFKFG